MNNHRARRAVLELDGEVYEEHQAYDPLMIGKMWGYNLGSKEEIKQTLAAEKDVDILLKRSIITPGDTVFIGGARHGNYLFSFRDRAIEAYGVEQNQEIVDFIQSVVPNDYLHHGYLAQLPFADDRFDIGFFHSSLLMNENTELNKAEIKEILRVLKQGGTILLEGANGVYWEPIRKKAGELYEFSSVEEGLWALKKDPALAKWRRKSKFFWLEFFFITFNTEMLRVNHVYHFVPKQDGVAKARYYHEVVNYEPFEYRLELLDQEGYVNRNHEPLSMGDIYQDYALEKPFDPQTSPGGIIVATCK